MPDTDTDTESEPFDAEKLRLRSEVRYRAVRPRYESFASVVEQLLRSSLESSGIQVHSIQSRAKTIESFGVKASQSSPQDPNKPKYADPLTEITDLAAARVITFFLSAVQEAEASIADQFVVVARLDKTLQGEARLGYQSVHYLVTLTETRLNLPEYAAFKGLKAEIQIRTILQHAWAEIEHDIQYKSVDALPMEIRRRFLALAGMLEMGDREFQAISDDHETLRAQARENVETGQRLDEVELTADALRAFLNKRLSPDGRMADWNYAWTAKMIKQLGFVNIEQVAEAIAPYSDDRVSRLLHGQRQGQLTRFEDVLLAGMGETFIERHPWNSETTWFASQARDKLSKLSRGGIRVGDYDPITPIKVEDT